MRDIRLGISPLSWTNQSILELGEHISYEECVTQAAIAGFTGVELGRKFPDNPSAILSTLADVGMVPVSSWYSGFLGDRSVEEEWPDAEPMIKHLKALGCEVIVYGECACGPNGGASAALDDTPALDTIDLASYAKRITEFADRVSQAGLTLVYHPHVMMPVETVDEIDQFMNSVGPAVRLLLDTGHIEMTGGDYRTVMNKWWHRISHIHLKDIRQDVLTSLDRTNTTFDQAVIDGIFTVPGDGDIDFEPLIQKIATDGYDGWLLVEAEQDPLKAEPTVMAATAMTYLATLLERHKLSFERNTSLERA
jgi:inosose dehydratase